MPSSSDPLLTVLNAYREAVVALNQSTPTVDERIKFRGDWRERLLTAARANNKSEYYKAALAKAVGLSNGLGDETMADALSKELSSLEDDPQQKARWLGEQGEIARKLFLQTGNESQQKQATAAFEEAIRLLRESSAVDARVQYVVNSVMLAELSVANSPSAAVKILAAAEKTIEADKEVEQKLASMQFGRERLYRLSVRAKAALRDVEGVHATLHSLSELPALDQQLWITVLKAAEEIYPSDGKSNLESRLRFLERWQYAGDGKTLRSPMLLFHIAGIKFKLNQFKAAQEDYENLHDNYKQLLLQHDGLALETNTGGYYAEVLFNLAACYVQEGVREQAKQLLLELEKLVPKDPRIEILRNLLANSTGKPEARISLGSWPLWIVCISMASGLLLLRRGRAK